MTWHFGEGDVEARLHPKSVLQVNDLRIALKAARAGLGIARLPRLLAQEALSSGDLVELLPEWRRPPVPVQLVYHGRRLQSAAQTAFMEYALERVADMDRR